MTERKAPRTKQWPVPDESIPTPNLVRLLNDTMPLMTVKDSADVESGGVRQMDFSSAFTITEVEQGEVLIELSGNNRTIGPGGTPGLVLDLDPAELVGIATDGSNISYCPDATPNGYNATQASSGQYPQWLDNVLNDYPVLHFRSARGDQLRTPTIVNPTLGASVIFVARLVDTPIEHATFFDFSNGTDVSDPDCWIHVEGSSTPNDLTWSSPPTTIGSGSVGEWFSLGIQFVSSSVAYPWYNGVKGSSFSPAVALNAVKSLILGKGPTVGGSGTADFHFARALEWDSVLTDTEMATELRAVRDIYNLLQGSRLAVNVISPSVSTATLAWDSTKNYKAGDLVIDGSGGTFIALVTNTNVTPVDGTTWGQIATGSGGGGGIGSGFSYVGYNTIGASTESSSGVQWMKKVTFASAGMVTNIEAYGDVASQFVMPVAAGIQTDNSGSPDHFIGGGGANFNLATSVPRWLGVPVNVYIPAAGDYWLCFKTENTFGIRYDTGTDRSRNDSTNNNYLKDGSIAAITTTAKKYSIRAVFLA